MAPERIVAAALTLVDEQGVAALSMRTLAAHLDSGTATLYRHFSSRADLVAQVVDRMFADIEAKDEAPEGASVEARIKVAAHSLFDVLIQHPQVARLLLEQIPLGPNAMAMRERWLEVLLDGGFAPEVAAQIYATLARFVLGFAIQFSSEADADPQADAETFGHVDPERFSAVRAAADSLPVPLHVEFEFGLDLLVRGLAELRP